MSIILTRLRNSYGTLMKQEVLAKYAFGLSILPKSSNIVINKASLQKYKKYHVREENYPAIIFDEKSSVNGVLVYNLTKKNIEMLDEYEGDEYERKFLTVYDHNLKENVKAECYVWIDAVDRLVDLDIEY